MHNGTITDCVNVGKIFCKSDLNIMGSDNWVGGVAGNIAGEAIMQRCYNTGDVSLEVVGTQGEYQRLGSGGCLGRNQAKIVDCYNTGNVSATAGYNVNIGSVFGRLSDKRRYCGKCILQSNRGNKWFW